MLHGLRLNPIGDRYELMTREDIEKVCVPLGSVVWELPQREIGGFLPEWADLQAQVAAARAKGAANRLGSYRDDGWGFATHALHNMDVLLPRMTEFRDHARAIAAASTPTGWRRPCRKCRPRRSFTFTCRCPAPPRNGPGTPFAPGKASRCSLASSRNPTRAGAASS